MGFRILGQAKIQKPFSMSPVRIGKKPILYLKSNPPKTRHDFSSLILIPPFFSPKVFQTMKRFAFLLIVALHAALAAMLYAAPPTTEPPAFKTEVGPLPDEDVLLGRIVFLHSLTSIDIYKGRADIIHNGQFHFMQGQGGFDKYGALEFLESPTGNAVTILPDGSCDLYLDGHSYRFNPE